MANATSTQLQELYVAYFGRAADPTGLDYWTEKGITQAKFASDMYAQAEFKDAYGSLSTESQVNQIYKNLFDREADVTGLTYWTQQINLGTLKVAEIATHLIWAAQNNSGSSDDKTALTNRTNAAVAYTAKVKETTAGILAYQAESTGTTFVKGVNITEAISYLSGIDKDTVHTAAGIAASVAVITTNGVPTAAVAGKAITLTTSNDVVNKTSATAAMTTGEGNDVIYGLTTGQLTSGDVIDGAGGADKIQASVTANSQTIKPVLTSIETVEVTQTYANTKDIVFDVTSTDKAVTTVKLLSEETTASGSDSEITLKGVQTTDAVTFTGPVTGGSISSATITYDSVTGSADTASLTLGGKVTDVLVAGIETLTVNTKAFTGLVTAEEAETVTITAGALTTDTTTISDVVQATAVLATLNLGGTGEAIDAEVANIDFKGNGVVNITNTGSTLVALANLAASTNTLTVTGGAGADTVDIDELAQGTVTVNTGAGDDTVLIDAGVLTVNTGAGNDLLKVETWADVTTADSIDLGDGTLDRVQTSQTTLGSSQKTRAGYFSNVEIFESTSTTNLTADINGLSVVNHVIASGAMTATTDEDADTDGADAISATLDSTDILEIRASITGEGGGNGTVADTATTGNTGGDGIDLDPKVDTGSNIATLRLVGAVTLTGGVGERSETEADGTGGAGGHALIADTIDTLNLVGVNTAATAATANTVTFTAGAGGITQHANATAGTAGSSITVAANSKIVLSNEVDPFTSTAKAVGASNFVLGTVKGTNVEVDGSALTGTLSVTAADGNVIITGGSGNDIIFGGTGIDTISGGAGNDTLDPGTGADIITTGAGIDHIDITTAGDAGLTGTEEITDYTPGVGGDVIDYVAVTTLLTAQSATNVVSAVTSSAGTDTLTASVTNGFITLAGNAVAKVDTAAELDLIFEVLDTNNTAEIGAIEMGGSTYFIADGADGGADTVNDIIKLTGLTGITAVSTTAADNTITII